MTGKLNDPGNRKQRATFVLKAVRWAIGSMIHHDPDGEEVAEFESNLNTRMSYTKRFEAHTENESLLAAVWTLMLYIDDPDSVISDKKRERALPSKSEVKALAKKLLAVATPDDHLTDEDVA